MVASSTAMALAMLCLAANVLYLEAARTQRKETPPPPLSREEDEGESEQPPTYLLWLETLPVVEIVAYMLAFGLGVGTVPWLLLGELCPAKVKGLASGA